MEQANVYYALLLTLVAGLSTGIGSLLAMVVKHTNTRLLSFALGLSAGVMIYVSFVDIFPKAQDTLTQLHGDKLGGAYTALAFFGGMLLIAIIDKLVPTVENPHEYKNIKSLNELEQAKSSKKIMRMGVLTAIVIAIHNFPEGIATFMAALQDPEMGFAIAVAIAIHNIPEGVAVAIPIYIATSSKLKAFTWSALSGLAEPLGAILAYFILMPYISDTTMGVVFASVAGIMVYISIDELLPAAREWGKHHISIWGMIVGMVIMAGAIIALA